MCISTQFVCPPEKETGKWRQISQIVLFRLIQTKNCTVCLRLFDLPLKSSARRRSHRVTDFFPFLVFSSEDKQSPKWQFFRLSQALYKSTCKWHVFDKNDHVPNMNFCSKSVSFMSIYINNETTWRMVILGFVYLLMKIPETKETGDIVILAVSDDVVDAVLSTIELFCAPMN